MIDLNQYYSILKLWNNKIMCGVFFKSNLGLLAFLSVPQRLNSSVATFHSMKKLALRYLNLMEKISRTIGVS